MIATSNGARLLRPDHARVVVVLLDDRRHDPADPDPVGPHHVETLRPVLGLIGRLERLRVVGPQLVDVPDDDRASDMELAAVHRASVTLADLDEVLPSVDPEVAVHVRARHVHVGPVRARDPVRAPTDRWVGEDRDVRAEPLRTHESLREPEPGEVLVLEAPHPFGEVEARELLLPHLAVARDQDGDGSALDVEQDALQRGLGGHAHLLDHQLDRHRTGRLDLREGLELAGSRRLGCARRRGLGIREVVAVLAPDEQVLTDVGEGHELVVHPTADRPGIGLDDHGVQAQAVEHPLVGLVHHAVGLAHPVLVPIERVRVLHQELARRAGARTEDGARPGTSTPPDTR